MTTAEITRHPLTWFLVLSLGISGFLVWLIYFKPAATAEGDWVTLLPAANSCFNALCACCLVGGFVNIKRGNRQTHMRFMLAALFFSALFLISYILYHYFHGDTSFPGQGPIRIIYFFILISHIVLSVVTLPLVFTTVYHAVRGQFESHKKIARYTFPIWLYVSVTGVLVYFFLRAYT